jgi:hypothetical protein
MSTLRRLALIILFVLTLCSLALGQTQITTGVIQGTIMDQSGAVMPGADVAAKNLNTQVETTQKTDGDGRFVFLSLSPGPYSVTASKTGFSKLVQKDVELTVGQSLNLRLALRVSATSEVVEVTGTPMIEATQTTSSTTLDERTVSETPILGRKFEDLLTLTPGVSVVQGPDGDEISFAGQRGIFNNISLDGGDYNNGFFGEQVGGQRAAIDITLDAVKEFQVIASGASAEFGRSAGGVINVVTKSGTDQVHGSLFHYQRLEALTANTSDGKPLKDFHREQFGATIGGPIVKHKMFYFGAFEQILENLTRPNLSVQQGPTACPVATPTVAANPTLLAPTGNADCQRLALLNFFQTSRGQAEGLPIKHPVRNTALLGKFDWTLNPNHNMSASYNFDRSNNENQTFDVPTYGNSANGIEGPSKINSVNFNLFSTLSARRVNEGHVSFSREDRPRSAVDSKVPADTAMGFGGATTPTFRFGAPFFLEPGVDETFKRVQVRDNFSILYGKHAVKFGGEWLHSNNSQVFRGFFTGRYIFDSVLGFLHYASPASLGPGFGPNTGECAGGTFGPLSAACPSSPLLLYLQHAATNGPTTDAAGFSDISNNNYALFIQDKWQIRRNLSLDYGLRWEAQIFPDPVIDPSKTAYGVNLSDPRFPSNGKIPNATKMFQPRLGLAWDVRGDGKSSVRASWGIYNAQQNMLTQVGAITTNGVQQQTIFAGDVPGGFVGATGFNTPGPTWPNPITPTAVAPGTFPPGAGVTVFDRNYNNPRTYIADFGYTQELAPEWAGYIDLAWAKGVYLTRFVDPNTGSTAVIPTNGDVATYSGTAPFPNLGSVTDTQSSAHSLYRGFTIGTRKRFGKGFQMEANYVLSEDLDDDSNERDPFTFRYFNKFDFRKDYTFSDRDSRHKFNFYAVTNLPAGFQFSGRIQAHTAQPITDNLLGDGTGAPCSPSNSITRVVNGIDCGRNHLRKDNGFFTFDWRAVRPFKFGDRYVLTPMFEMFNSFNNRNNVNPLVTPGLFNFDGFLRQGVGDPLQAQFAVKFSF